MRWWIGLLAGTAALAADPALMRLAMPEAKTLAWVDVARVRATPAGRVLLQEFGGEDKEFKDFVAATGFDPTRHIQEAVYSSPGSGDRWLLALRGTFPAAKLMTLARETGASIIHESGIDIASGAQLAAAVPGGKPLAFAILSPTMALAGDDLSVRDAVARRRTAPGPPAALVQAGSRMGPTYPAWFALQGPIEVEAEGLGPLSGEVLKTVQRASGGATFDQNVNVRADLLERTPNEAKALGEVLRFLAGLSAAAPQGQLPPLAAALETVKVETLGATLKVSASLPPKLVRALLSDTETEP